MNGKRIVVGISGGIAAFKSASLVSKLTQAGADVHVIMTSSATQFITPLTLQALSRNPVSIDTFAEQNPGVINHIDLADHADLFILAPATANLISKLAVGLGDDMLTTTILATRAPICIAPAMNVHMYQNPIVQENIGRLHSLGFHLIEPGAGQLACGYVGKGRMAEPEEIVAWTERFFTQERCLAGKKVLITAGPTVEPVDPVRFFSNHSSGKMGYALARAAEQAGAEVMLISGPVHLKVPANVTRINVKTGQEMYEAVMERLNQVDVVIKAAAVADYRPIDVLPQKIKKNADQLHLALTKNPDIAASVGKQKRPDQLLVGFAAETEHVAKYAQEKRARKNMDLIIANQVSQPGIGFGSDQNRVTVFDQTGEVLDLPVMSKEEIAIKIISLIGERTHDR